MSHFLTFSPCEFTVRILFHEGLGIGHVVLGIIRLAGAGGLDVFGRHAPDFVDFSISKIRRLIIR